MAPIGLVIYVKRTRIPLRRDEAAVSPLILIGVVIVLVIIVVAIFLMAVGDGDRYDGNKPTEDTKFVISADVKIGDFDNQIGSVEARDIDFKLDSTGYAGEDGWFPGLEIAGFWDIFANEFKFTCMVRCTGPGGFEATAQDVKTIQVDEWDWGERKITFHTLRFFVEEKGRYTLTLEIIVDAEDEGLDKETVATDTKSIGVS